MAPSPRSPSEGAYLSSDSETKAHKAHLYHKDRLVNRHPRNDSRRDRSRSRSRSPSHSRSPYRASRGEKRPRDSEYRSSQQRHDPRRHQVRYEDDRQSRNHHGSDRALKKQRRRSPSRSRSRSPYRNPRDRSRSPFRHARDKSRSPFRHERHRSRSPFRHDRIRSKSPNRQVRVAEVSVVAKEVSPSPSMSTQARSLDSFPLSEKPSQVTEQAASAEPANAKMAEYVRPEAQVDGAESRSSMGPIDPLSAVMDETSLIEARRKRRETIKAQYQKSQPNLLVQALHKSNGPAPDSLNTTPEPSSNLSTTNVSSEPASPARDPISAPGTPRTEHNASAPDSPAEIFFSKDEDLANLDVASPREDGPSAADYDPTLDMQDERARHDKTLFKEDEQAEEEAHLNAQSKLEENTQNNQKAKGDYDMFADDDDDMFAPSPAKNSQLNTRAAQTLDAGMMDNWDDHEGYYKTQLGELIDGRYKITENLGRGMFASVVRASDEKSDKLVAIKIIRNNSSMRKAGLKEVDILKDLAANDPDDRKHVIRLLRSFDHKAHLCMVFENMSMNLRDVLKKFGRDVGINLKAVRAYAHQLFTGLSLMKKCQYLHADLKPDNILVNEARSIIKIADLGSASSITENATAPYLVSRFYRAPEIILGIEYDYSIDMWSIGCTLYELYTGKILFTGRNNNNMLKTIMDTRGKIPQRVLRRGQFTLDYFEPETLKFKAQDHDKTTGRIVTKLVNVPSKPLKDLRAKVFPKDRKFQENEKRELEGFVDLLDKCLALAPEKRITPGEALKHHFFAKAK